MKRKIVSLLMAVMMLVTVFYVPVGLHSYAEDSIGGENMEDSIIDDNDNTAEEKVNLSAADISIGTTYYCPGKSRLPKIVLEYNGVALTEGIDYTVSNAVGYSNIYPGTGKIVITGINNYEGSIEKSYYIARVANLKVKDYGTNYVSIKWDKQINVSGYKVYRYMYGENKWKCIKTIKGSNTTSYKVGNLTPSTGCTFKVCAYVNKGSKTYYGTRSLELNVPTRPNKVVLKSFTATPLSIKATWGERKCSGYHILVSKKSNMSNPSQFFIRKSTLTSKTMKSLTVGSTYYLKVRAYREYKGKTVYGAWSGIKSVKFTGKGWVTSGNKKYYYNNAKAVTGQKTISGKKYYFDPKTGELRGVTVTMWNKVKGQSSKTKWLVAISKDLNVTCVYHKVDGQWTVRYYWTCATGAIGTGTPRGYFSTPKTKSRLRYMGTESYTCWYATRITKRVYMHSVLYNPMSMTSIQDGRLGQRLSHGCIRLNIKNAKWLYDNIKPGTKVVIY